MFNYRGLSLYGKKYILIVSIIRRSAMLSFQSNKKQDRQQYQNAICKMPLDSCYKPLRSESDVGMANYKKFSYLILKKIFLCRPNRHRVLWFGAAQINESLLYSLTIRLQQVIWIIIIIIITIPPEVQKCLIHIRFCTSFTEKKSCFSALISNPTEC